MCDRARFFRPWHGESETSEVKNGSVVNETRIPDVRACSDEDIAIKSEVNERLSPKRETLREDYDRMELEEDEEGLDSTSVVSSLSGGATSETGSYHSCHESRKTRGRKLPSRRQSTSSSCSVHSCEDIPETGSLRMLSNFVYGEPVESQNGRAKDDIAMANRDSSGRSSSSENSSCNSRNSPHSAFAPTPYQCPIYPGLDYLAPLRVGSFENATAAAAAAAAAISFDPNSAAQHSHHANLIYGLPTMPMGSYCSSMEQAVKYIHQQDVAAKQMKKLRPKKFRCEHCDVAFSNNGQLKGHVRIHTGERPFKCDADGCGKSFTRNEELTRHKRIHTGLRPHSCLLCGKSFGRKDHLKKHTRTHDNRGAYHIPAPTLGPFALGHHHSFPPGHPVSSYIYPI